jgi:hypothetical protein
MPQEVGAICLGSNEPHRTRWIGQRGNTRLSATSDGGIQVAWEAEPIKLSLNGIRRPWRVG